MDDEGESYSAAPRKSEGESDDANVRVRSSCRFIRSSCISFWKLLASASLRVRYHVMFERCAAMNSAAEVVSVCVRRTGRRRRMVLDFDDADSALPIYVRRYVSVTRRQDRRHETQIPTFL